MLLKQFNSGIKAKTGTTQRQWPRCEIQGLWSWLVMPTPLGTQSTWSKTIKHNKIGTCTLYMYASWVMSSVSALQRSEKTFVILQLQKLRNFKLTCTYMYVHVHVWSMWSWEWHQTSWEIIPSDMLSCLRKCEMHHGHSCTQIWEENCYDRNYRTSFSDSVPSRFRVKTQSTLKMLHPCSTGYFWNCYHWNIDNFLFERKTNYFNLYCI